MADGAAKYELAVTILHRSGTMPKQAVDRRIQIGEVPGQVVEGK
jgi:hypothetical protein